MKKLYLMIMLLLVGCASEHAKPVKSNLDPQTEQLYSSQQNFNRSANPGTMSASKMISPIVH